MQWIGWGAWLSLTLATTVIVLFRPLRTVTPIYRKAALDWWDKVDLYGPGIHGFLYLPTSAIFYTPFAEAGLVAGDVAWRLLSVGLFTWALVRLARLLSPERAAGMVALTLLVIVPSAGINVIRAQSEIIMAALMIHAVIDLAGERWWRAAALLALAVALKPLALVLALAVFALYPALRLRLLAGLAAALLLPFLNPDPAWVAGQYLAFIDKMKVASDPGPGRWNELTQMLEHFGVRLPAEVMTGVRLVAALAVLGLGWLASRRFGPAARAVLLLMLCVSYTLVFNARTEEGSYMTLAAFAGLLAGLAVGRGHRRGAAAFIGLALALGTQGYGNWIYRPTDIWLKPLLALGFIAFLAARIIAGDADALLAAPRQTPRR